MGDVAGIGPEVVARAAAGSDLAFEPLVVGDPDTLARALQLVGVPHGVRSLDSSAPDSFNEVVPGETSIACWNPTDVRLEEISPATVDARCGQAAADWLHGATAAARAGDVDAIVTAPLNKLALAEAGIDVPGHTELLARACNCEDVAMMLYLPPSAPPISGPHGLGVAHATLHTSIASIPSLLSVDRIGERIRLLDQFLRRTGCPSPRIGVCALNPHAGEAGLFGDEESRLIAPAVETSRTVGIAASGPWPADTLMGRAVGGEFDGVVAMYHDQGHIALKLVGCHAAVNVTLGLPIVRTSPSHGTAFDIAWQGTADARGMFAAIETALRLCGGTRTT
tara:strand:+ start:880 stop:1893 length:1014 start_codon:yes stop_codon:yes gene_type:complete